MTDDHSDPSSDPMRLRASDKDREKYVDLLQNAYVEGRLSRDEYDERMERAYRASTYADLAPLAQDLPIDPADLPAPPASRALVHPRAESQSVTDRVGQVEHPHGSSPVIAVFSQAVRDGQWGVPNDQVAVAVFGQVSVDLRDAALTSGQLEMKVSAVFGEVKVIVPDDIYADVAGVGVLGDYKKVDDREVSRRGTVPPVGAPRIKFVGAAVFGSVTVTVVSAASSTQPRVQPGNPPGIQPPTQQQLPPGSDGSA